MPKIKVPSTLDITIEPADKTVIEATLNDVNGIAPLSINQTLAILQTEGESSAIFAGLRRFLRLTEGFSTVTYNVGTHETIGIGLDLIEHPEAIALFYQIDPNTNWKKIFPDMQQHSGLPNPPLTEAQVYSLLYWTLVGVNNEYGNFVGLINNLLEPLKSKKLDDKLFQPYQIIALQSMAYNAENLIGEKLLAALNHLVQTNGDDLAVMIQIVECSNKDRDVGISNRRLKEAGLFHGNPDKVSLTWREFNKIKAVHPDIQVYGGPAIHGLPIGNEEETYLGRMQVKVDPGCDPQQLDSVYFGSYQPDTFNKLQGGSKVVFGGGGNDEMSTENKNSEDDNSTSYHYFAGNVGKDVYKLNKKSGHPLIFDADHDGILQLDSDSNEIAGIGIATGANKFVLQGKNQTYILTRLKSNFKKSDEKNFDSGDSLNINWGDANNDINIANFIGGQFNIALINQPWSASGQISILAGTILPNKMTVLMTYSIDGMSLQIRDQNGNIYKQFSLPFSLDLSDASMTSIANGNIVVICNCGCSIGGVVANINGIINTFQITYPATYTCPPYSILSRINVIALDDGTFATIYMLGIEKSSVLCCQLSTASNSVVLADFNVGYAYASLLKVTYLGETRFAALISTSKTELYICDTNGKILYDFAVSDSTVISRLADGFMIAFPQENLIFTQIFKYSGGWSTATKIAPGQGAIFAAPLPNQSTMIGYTSPNWNINIIMLDANNRKIGEPSDLSPNGQSAGLVSIANLPNGDMGLLFGFFNIHGTVDINAFYCETSALQLQSTEQPHEKITISNKKTNSKNSIRIKDDDDHPQQISAASQLKNPWHLPLKFSKFITGGIAVTWNYLQNPKHTENVKTENSTATVLSVFKDKKKLSDKTTTVPCENVKIEETPALECSNKNYTAYVFPKVPETTNISRNIAPNLPIKSDMYNPSTCRPVEFYGEASVFCEGEKTNLIYTPHLPTPLLENLDGNIRLGTVAINTLVNLSKPTESEEFLSPLMYQKEMQRFERKLEWLEQEFHLANQALPIAVEDLRLDLAKLKHQGKTTKAEAKAFRDGIKDARKYLRQMSKYLEAKQQLLKNISSRKLYDKNKTDSTLNLLTPQSFFAEKHRIDLNNEPRTLPKNPVNIIPRLT